MLAYAVRRLIGTVPLLLGVTLLLFVVIYAVPGDPARMSTGYRATSAQALDNMRENMGLKPPLYRQYFSYLAALSRGDLGLSFRTRRPVAAIIAESLPNSIGLALFALLLEMLIAVPLGVATALKRDTFFDRASLLAATILAATPVFLLGLGFQLLFALKLQWLPVAGLGDGAWRYYVLPSAVMAMIAAAYMTRVVRASLLGVLSMDFITAARANGLPEVRVLFIHALKPALPPILSLAGLHFGFLMGSAVATETVFNWPGIGHRLLTAVMARDRPLVVGTTLVLATAVILVNLAVDLLNMWINPKLRDGYPNGRREI